MLNRPHVRHNDRVTTSAWPGSHQPLGATWDAESTNFAVFAPEATTVELCLFDDDDVETRYTLTEQTLGIWHGALPGIEPGQRYGFRADGPWQPQRGRVFNPAKLLLDPYARAVSGSVDATGPIYGYPRPACRRPRPGPCSARRSPRRARLRAVRRARRSSVRDDFDWGDDDRVRPRHKWTDTIVYEAHVKGFTQLHNEVPEDLRGTYAGLTTNAAVHYLKDLGITTVELLPVHQFVSEPDLAERGLTNYWGYNSIGFFAPHGGVRLERRPRRAGHRVQGDGQGAARGRARGDPRRGLQPHRRGRPAGPDAELPRPRRHRLLQARRRVKGRRTSTSPAAATRVDAAYPPALRMILDSLRYWVTEMHVDGFRFDLTPALTRTGHRVDLNGHFITTIGQDPVLRHVKLIAEPWDASMDGYQVGASRRRGASGTTSTATRVARLLAARVRRHPRRRLTAVRLLRPVRRRRPLAVRLGQLRHRARRVHAARPGVLQPQAQRGQRRAQPRRHRQQPVLELRGRGRDRRPEIVALRRKQAANLLVTLCLSTGVPMITAGDERGRTQGGNNNAYVQDNETSWMDWRPDDAWLDLYDIAKTALRLRREHPALRQRHFLRGPADRSRAGPRTSPGCTPRAAR